MTAEMIVVLVLLACAVSLFVSEKLSVDLVALIVMAILLASGIVTVEQGIAGFSNPATVTVAAMFVLSAGLARTGGLTVVAGVLTRLGKKSAWPAIVSMMLLAAVCSAFINNTAVVAVSLPIALSVARTLKISPSKVLMPLSFASMFGGVCTLIGTSTNILVSSIAERHGQAAFSMFELSRIGFFLLAAGMAYMLLFGVRMIPERRVSAELTTTFDLKNYVTDVILDASADSAGTIASRSPLVQEAGVDILAVFRDGNRLPWPPDSIILRAGDVLRVRCAIDKIDELQNRQGIRLKSDELKLTDSDIESGQEALVEAVISPNSVLEGATLKSIRFRETFGGRVLAMRHRDRLVHDRIDDVPLAGGDTLLIEIRRDLVERLKSRRAFTFVSEAGVPTYRRRKTVVALGIAAAVVAIAASGWTPIVVSAIAGCVLLVLTGCLQLDEAYDAIEWRVIFLLAGVLTLGTALEQTGAARLLSEHMLAAIGRFGPVAMLTAFYLLTTALTEAMSNNATAALLAPIAISAAESMDVSARPFLVAVTVAASSSFMTPVGYQTNTLIYGPGQYRFGDFLRVGAPLNILFWLLATWLIPQFWKFQ